MCASKPDETWKVMPINSKDVTSCHVNLLISHPAGCMKGSFSSFSFGGMLFWLLILFAIYIGVGYILNTKKGLVGAEAVPHIEVWRNLPHYCGLAFNYSKDLVAKITKRGA